MKKVIFGLMVTSLFLTGCSSTNTSEVDELKETIASLSKENENLRNGQGVNETATSNTTDSSKMAESNEAKGLNEDVVYYDENNNDLAQLKITKASTNQSAFPDYMLSMDEYDTENMIAVTVEFKNIGYEDRFYVTPSDFVAFDASGKAYEITMQQEGQDQLSAGRESTSTVYWKIPNAQNVDEIEIDYSPGVFYGAPTQTFKVNVEH